MNDLSSLTLLRRGAVCVLALAMCSLSGLADAQTYRWKDPRTGRTIISDQPPPAGIKPLGRSAPAAAPEGGAAGGAVPYAVREAMRDFPVRLYTAPGCKDECQQARLLLQGRGVPYSEESIVTRAAVDKLKQLSGQNGVPVLLVGQQVVVGVQQARWNQTLDLAGYPKTAYAGYRPPAPPVESVMPPPVEATPQAAGQSSETPVSDDGTPQ